MNIVSTPATLDPYLALRTSLNNECEGIEDIIAACKNRMDFVSLLKRVISSESEAMTVSNRMYERLQLAIQKNSRHLMTQMTHLKCLTSYLIKYPTSVTKDKKEFRNYFCEMVKKGEPQFGMVYFRPGRPTGHFIAVYFERKNDSIHVLVSDGEGSSFDVSGIVFELEKAIRDEKMKETISCYTLSQRRQNDNFSCSMFALKDLSIFSDFSFIELLEKNEQPLPVREDMVLGVEEEDEEGMPPQVKYFLLDDLADQLPSSYIKGSQITAIPPKLKAKVEVKRATAVGAYGTGSISFSSSSEEVNFYTRYFNLKCLAKAVDEGAL